MKNSEFEEHALQINEEFSFIDNKGETSYGSYNGSYDSSISSFNFKMKQSGEVVTIYLKDVEKLFKQPI